MTKPPHSPTDLMHELKKLEGLNSDVDKRIILARDTLARRYPIVFVLISTFGLVATLYGIEKLIDQTAWLSERPYIILAVGLLALLCSGTLMRKLK